MVGNSYLGSKWLCVFNRGIGAALESVLAELNEHDKIPIALQLLLGVVPRASPFTPIPSNTAPSTSEHSWSVKARGLVVRHRHPLTGISNQRSRRLPVRHAQPWRLA